MAKLRYLERHVWIYAVDALLDPRHLGCPYSREELVRLQIGDRYHDWITVSACVQDLRVAALGASVAYSIGDLPPGHEERQSYDLYAYASGLDQSRQMDRPLCDLAGRDYCRFLALSGLSHTPSPHDVWHWCRIALDPAYRNDEQDRGDRDALAYLRRLPLTAAIIDDRD